MLLGIDAVWSVVGEGGPGARASSASPSSRSSCISSRQQIKRGVERKSPKPQKWQIIGTKFDMNSCRLLFCTFMYLGCWCIGTVCEENDTETEPLHFAGCLIINRDVTGWLCCSLGTTADCLRVVFTSLPLQRHHMWSKYMRCVDGICGQ